MMRDEFGLSDQYSVDMHVHAVELYIYIENRMASLWDCR